MWIVWLSLVIGVGRFFVPGHQLSLAGTYEAFAHIWVGALIVFACSGYDRDATGYLKDRRIVAVLCLVAITLIETVKFLCFKFA